MKITNDMYTTLFNEITKVEEELQVIVENVYILLTKFPLMFILKIVR